MNNQKAIIERAPSGVARLANPEDAPPDLVEFLDLDQGAEDSCYVSMLEEYASAPEDPDLAIRVSPTSGDRVVVWWASEVD